MQQEKTALINDYESKISSMEKLQIRQIAEMKKEHQKIYNEAVKSMEDKIQGMKK